MIILNDLSIRLGHFKLQQVNLTIERNQYGVLMGKTGCGKTTVLEAICGLRRVTGGSIYLGDRDVTNLKPAERGIGFVPQEGAVFTTMTVRRNIGFALSVRKWKRQAIRERVDEIAEAVGVTHLLDRKPYGLSGGERQRIALARALAFKPDILCLDEPLSALDYDTRNDMCILLKKIAQETGVTTLHITHNRNEAIKLADQIFIFQDGAIQQTSRQSLIPKQQETLLDDI